MEFKRTQKQQGKPVLKPAKKENPFDKFANARKKHEILNRKVKGEDRNMGRARAKAIDERKKKLLTDYQTSKKSNSFLDKRFGESDPTMSLEEKMFLRFQKERTQKARNGSVYNLGDDDNQEEVMLTHKGQILGDSNIADNDFSSDDDDEGKGGKLDKEVVDKLHFGGGFVPKDESQPHKKGRLEALQEIVMKSKMYKVQRKEAKEEQETQREKIDLAFQDLLSSEMVNYDENRGRPAPGSAMAEIDDYDKMMHEMTYEAKAQPAERTKTAEELALEERERIEELEKARLKRMREAREDGDEHQAKKSRVRNDDELDDFYFKKLKEDRYGDRSLTAPASARNDDDAEEGEDEDDEEGDDEEDGDDDDDDEDEDDEFAGLENDEEDDEEDGEDEDEDEEEEGFEQDDSEDDEEVAAKPAVITFEHLPHKVVCPSDSAAFDELLRSTCRHFPEDHIEMLSRIVSWNNVHLPGEKGAENRKLMHNFLDILLKYFVKLGSKLASTKNPEDYKKLLNHIDRIIFSICQDQSDASVNLWARTLKIVYGQYQKQTRDYSLGEETTCWPSLGKLFLLQSLGHVFSTTDLHHDILDPARLMLSQFLTQCPVASPRDLASGLFAVGVLLDYSAESKRLCPEVIAYLSAALVVFAPSTFATSKHADTFLLGTFKYENFAGLRRVLSEKKGAKKNSKDHNSSSNPNLQTKLPWRVFQTVSSASGEEDGESADVEVAEGLLLALYRLVLVVAARVRDHASCHHSAAPEVLHPLVVVLKALRPHDTTATSLATVYQQRHLEVLEEVLRVSEEVRTVRQPLFWRKMITNNVESKAPRFEANYTIKKDQESDKDRAKLKQLNRQLKREKKAAMRELRRDAAFIDQERFKEQQVEQAAKRAERVKNFAWLEDQQATINLQVKKGKGLMKGGGSGVAKGPRPNRR